jgi:hypothetical protein
MFKEKGNNTELLGNSLQVRDQEGSNTGTLATDPIKELKYRTNNLARGCV